MTTLIVSTIPAGLVFIAIARQAGFDWWVAIVAAYFLVAWCAAAGYMYGRGQKPN